MKPLSDLTGNVFGEWTVLHRAVDNYKGHARWVCRCSCGEERTVLGGNLRRGKTVSCGHAARTQGGLWKDHVSEYDSWKQMHRRCYNSEAPYYSRYGGRGIMVSPRWHDFKLFLEDMGKRPFKGAELDRINNDGNYEPGNVRWATKQQNADNMSTTRYLTHDGITDTVTGWAQRLKVPRGLLSSRLHKGWPLERALAPRERKKHVKTHV